MKRYIRNGKKPKYIIDVLILTDTETPEVAASTEYVKHPVSIRNSGKMTDEELRFYNDFIDSMHVPILSLNFIVISEGQSKKSYAYYIDFYPVDKNGNKFEDSVKIRFRVADHNPRGDLDKVKGPLIIKSFKLDGVIYPSPISLQKKIIEICEHLQDGDFDYVSNLRT